MRVVSMLAFVALGVDPAKRLGTVIDTLKDLLLTIDKEEEDEKENYHSFAQWCTEEKTTKEKEIEEQSLSLEDLRVVLDQSEAAISKTSYVIDKNKEDMQDESTALQQAESIRNEERQEYEKDREINAISVKQLQSAIGIVNKIHQVGFLQQTQKTRLNSPGESSFVLGVFQSLQKNMRRNQESSEKDEKRRKQLFESLASDKSTLLHTIQEETEKKSISLAEILQRLSQATNDQKTTKAAQDEARKYLDETWQSCALKDKQWIVRQADRAKEKIAIQEAMVLLQIGLDEEKTNAANDAEKKNSTSAPSFLQIGKNSFAIASDPPSTSLAVLSTKINQYARSDQISGIKGKILELIAALEREQVEEKKKKVRCRSTEEQQEKDLGEKTDNMAQLRSLIKRKTELVATLGASVDEIKALMDETKAVNADMAKLRAKESAVFAKGVKERELALRVLKQAKVVLKKFYDSKDTVLMQLDKETTPGSGRHDGTSRVVLAMLDKISEDITRENVEEKQAEKEAQEAFEKNQENSMKEFDMRIEKLTEMSSRRAKTNVQLDSQEEDNSVLHEDIDSIRTQISARVEDCDEFLHTYDQREKTRSFDISQLKDTHGILSGASAAIRTGI